MLFLMVVLLEVEEPKLIDAKTVPPLNTFPSMSQLLPLLPEIEIPSDELEACTLHLFTVVELDVPKAIIISKLSPMNWHPEAERLMVVNEDASETVFAGL